MHKNSLCIVFIIKVFADVVRTCSYYLNKYYIAFLGPKNHTHATAKGLTEKKNCVPIWSMCVCALKWDQEHASILWLSFHHTNSVK